MLSKLEVQMNCGPLLKRGQGVGWRWGADELWAIVEALVCQRVNQRVAD